MPRIAGATTYPSFDAVAETAKIGADAIFELTGQRSQWKRPPRAADMSFWGVGLSVLMAIGPSKEPPETRNPSGSPWFWHTKADLLDKAGPDVLLTDTRIYALCAARICLPKLLPLSISDAVAELTSLLSRQSAASQGCFDFSPVFQALDALRATAACFEAQALLPLSDRQISLRNDRHSAALKNLCTINYTCAGEFIHDPAVPSTPLALLKDSALLPGMPGDEGGFLRTRLVRSRNMVVWHLCEAERLLREACI